MLLPGLATADTTATEYGHPLLDPLPGAELTARASQDFHRYEVLLSNGIGESVRTREMEGRVTDMAFRIPARSVSVDAANRAYREMLEASDFTIHLDCDAAGNQCARGLLERWVQLSGRGDPWLDTDVRQLERDRAYRVITAIQDKETALTLVIAPGEGGKSVLLLASIIEPGEGTATRLVGASAIGHDMQVDGRARLDGIRLTPRKRHGPPHEGGRVMQPMMGHRHTHSALSALADYLAGNIGRTYMLVGHELARPHPRGGDCSARAIAGYLEATRESASRAHVEAICLPQQAGDRPEWIGGRMVWSTGVNLIAANE